MFIKGSDKYAWFVLILLLVASMFLSVEKETNMLLFVILAYLMFRDSV